MVAILPTVVSLQLHITVAVTTYTSHLLKLLLFTSIHGKFLNHVKSGDTKRLMTFVQLHTS